jgi:hypothetical protein
MELSVIQEFKFKINTDRNTLFSLISDLRNMPKIFEHIVSLEPTDGNNDIREGKEYLEKAVNLFGRQEKIKMLVKQIVPGHSIVMEVFNPRLKTFVKINVSENAHSSAELSIAYLSPIKGLLFTLSKLYFGMIAKKRLAKAQKNLNMLIAKK